MPQVINTNVSSLNAQRQLNRSQISQSTAMERLSSGLRINSAKDDAAGLAIADRMTSQIKGMNQAVRNANDGISLAQVAEGALQESSGILQRMRELSVQSANDTNSGSDRANIQKEVNQLKIELERIATTTSFNGRNVLDGTLSSALFHIGAYANQNVNISIGGIKTADFGVSEVLTDGSAIEQAQAGTANGATSTAITIKGSLGTAAPNLSAGSSAENIAATVNANTDKTGVSAQAINYATLSGASADGPVSFALQGSNNSPVTVSARLDQTNYSELSSAINAVSGQTGITATLSDDKKSITMVHSNGADIKVSSASGTTVAGLGVTGLKSDGETSAGSPVLFSASAEVTVGGSVSFYSPKGFTVGGSNDTIVAIDSAPSASKLKAVDTIDVSSQSLSNSAINIIDGALSFISDSRADLGALQNRFSSTISNLENISQNVSASRSRIQDADFAKESAELATTQILQQAGMSMLAQANASAQGVLSLLQG